jgi:hypothetical protein
MSKNLSIMSRSHAAHLKASLGLLEARILIEF